jgi:radical SAM superfamily enzyme YgiQ (UPF0313 family)
VKSEGEYTMVELCEYFELKKSLTNIEGIFYRDNGQVKRTATRPWMENLDSNLFLARHLFLNNLYRLRPSFGISHPVTSLDTNRGCTSNCIFCLFPRYRPYRARSANNIGDEIELIVNKYGIKEIYFVDHAFNINQQIAVKNCEEIIRRNIKINWTCKTRVDAVTPSLVRLMKRAGCLYDFFRCGIGLSGDLK